MSDDPHFESNFEKRLWEAQQMVYSLAERSDSEDPEVRERFAYAALEVCRNCADAYVILGAVAEEYEEDLERARELYENGVAAGERAIKRVLAATPFKDYRGAFYGVLETRPYVRARGSLAITLHELGEVQAAEEHAREVLRLNDMDNMGLRYTLAQWLYEQDRTEDLEKHLRKHHAFSRDDFKQDAGFEQEVPHVLPERYWRNRR